MSNPLPAFTSRWTPAKVLCLIVMGVLSAPLPACAVASPSQAADVERKDPQTPSGSKEILDAPTATLTAPEGQSVCVAKGEIVPNIDKSCWVVFQDKDNNYWFGSDGQGVYRYDGKAITRFTTMDGLSHDQVRGIHQHISTGHILITTNGGVSKYDGERFVTLPMNEMKSSDEGWVLNDHDTWLTGSAGPRRYDGKTLYQLKLPKSPEADEWHAKYPNVPTKPYDVWTVYKDRRGHMWFGTSCLGICRFDGKTREWMYEHHLVEIEGGGLFGIRSIIEDKDGAFWFCNTKYRFRMMRPPAASGDTATKSSGEIAYTREHGVDPAALPPGESPIYFQGIVDDQAGNLWMATYGFGVWRYDGRKITHYWIKDGENVVTLYSIYKDNHGGLWLASHEHGAYKFDGQSFEKFKP